jgi:hypothetical protein
MQNFDRFKNPSGDGYIDDNGAHHETADMVIQTGMLGFCGCGSPDENVSLLGKVLRLINSRQELTYDEWIIKVREVLPNGDIEYFMWYWLDKEEYTEHGGSVPGWLTPKGEQLLSDIEQWEKLADE